MTRQVAPVASGHRTLAGQLTDPPEVELPPDNSPEARAILPEVAHLAISVEHKIALSTLVKRARVDFETYLLLFNLPGQGFIYSRLHEYLAEKVQAVADKRAKKRQAVSVPPQHGKSTVLSKEAGSWLLGRFPGIQLAITSFSFELVTDISKAIRDRVQHPLYRLIFPGTDIVFGSNKMDNWRLTNGSGLRAKPIGSKLTGRRVDWLIIDDAHAGREEAESATMRKRVLDWYFADCFTRLSPTAPVFIIGTRWHPSDLIGSLTSEETVAGLRAAGQEAEVYEVTNLPAECEDEETDPLGRKLGDPLFPEWRGRDFLASVKSALPEYEWISQYQGRPSPGGSGQVETGNFIYIDAPEVPTGIEIVRSWDLAITEEQRNDFIAGALMAYDEKRDRLFIIDIWHGKKTWPKMRPIMLEQTRFDREDWNVGRVGIEAVAGFGAVYQDVKAATLGQARVLAIYPPRGGKLARAMPWLNKIEAKRVYLVRGAWTKPFVEEVRLFPDGDNDDQIDAVSGGWEMLTGRNRNGQPLPAGAQRPQGVNRPPGAMTIPLPKETRPNPTRPGTPQTPEEEAEEAFTRMI